mmetsp:Transcript_44597/g.113975  ORF Transcript_44597/g.113975 Transcript_44597/m.113975 type:complete len:216 (-) Transcript_44597:697-1344(-)
MRGWPGLLRTGRCPCCVAKRERAEPLGVPLGVLTPDWRDTSGTRCASSADGLTFAAAQSGVPGSDCSADTVRSTVAISSSAEDIPESIRCGPLARVLMVRPPWPAGVAGALMLSALLSDSWRWMSAKGEVAEEEGAPSSPTRRLRSQSYVYAALPSSSTSRSAREGPVPEASPSAAARTSENSPASRRRRSTDATVWNTTSSGCARELKPDSSFT